MLKWIKRFFGLDYNDPKPNTHNGVGYSRETESKSEPSVTVHNGVGHLGVQIPVANTFEEPVVEVVSTPVKEKKPRKPAVKKAAPKKTTKKK